MAGACEVAQRYRANPPDQTESEQSGYGIRKCSRADLRVRRQPVALKPAGETGVQG